jgi:hypothetical protein
MDRFTTVGSTALSTPNPQVAVVAEILSGDAQLLPSISIQRRYHVAMQLDTRTAIEIAGAPTALGVLWTALARWWKRSKATVWLGPGRFEVRWRVDP